MYSDDLLYKHWFAFHMGGGRATKNKLIEENSEICKSPKELFEMSETQAKAYFKGENNLESFMASKSLESTKRDLDWLDHNGCSGKIKCIYWTDKDYPKRLDPLVDKPYGLYVKGELPDDGLPSLAMVGARDCTPYGIQAAEYFARELAESGVQIVSGLARGIDSCSHRGALKAAYGKTFGVLGCGIDVVYPARNQYLYDQIAEQGGVISEFLPGTQPYGANFPVRNRIISGLSDGVFIIEAKERSGTMITADQACEQGRDVFCLPGRYYDPLSVGCIELINNGAKAVCSPGQILTELNCAQQLELSLQQLLPSEDTRPSIPNEYGIGRYLSIEPKSIDKLVTESAMSVGEILSQLAVLEMKGLVTSTDNSYYCIKTSH